MGISIINNYSNFLKRKPERNLNAIRTAFGQRSNGVLIKS